MHPILTDIFFIGINNYLVGKIAAEQLLMLINYKGNVAIATTGSLTALNAIEKIIRNVTVKNGKLIKTFKCAYEGLHIAGYYRGIRYVEMIKIVFSDAKWIIEHLTGKRL